VTNQQLFGFKSKEQTLAGYRAISFGTGVNPNKPIPTAIRFNRSENVRSSIRHPAQWQDINNGDNQPEGMGQSRMHT